jgi:YidC/Oxa1 family membrane protein insertase
MHAIASIYTSPPFSWLISVNEAIVKFWHDQVGFSWGASIIGLTIVIRLGLLPLAFKQVRSMQGMQRLAPKMKELQKRYKEDKQRLNEEMMKLYREHGVNPFGSCLPTVLQLPFFFSLYGLQQSHTFKATVCPPVGKHPCSGSSFLFIPDILGRAHGGALAGLMILYVVTMLGSSLVSVTAIQDKNQKRLMMVLPFIFVPIVIRFPAGLLIYWITTNVWTVGQQLLIKRFLPPPQPLPAGAATEGDGTAGEPTGMWARAMRALAPPTETQQEDDAGKRRAKPPPAAKSGGTRSRNGADGAGPQKPPPRSPRKRKKRSGRRR